MSHTIELPEKAWLTLLQVAKADGMTPADWIATHLPSVSDGDGAIAQVELSSLYDLESPSYTSVPLELVGSVRVVCVAGKQVSPLPYPLEGVI